MKLKNVLVGIVSLASSGCAAYDLPPLSASHPANPQVLSTPERSMSKTLAYTRADIPATQPIVDSAMAQGHTTRQASQGEPQTVVADGKVVTTVPNAGQIVVEHG